MITEPINVTDAEFEATVLNADLPVLVDFWAPWCGPCRMIAPTLKNFAHDFAGKLLVAKVNTDENSEFARLYDVRSIPTLLFIWKGKLVHKQIGGMPESKMKVLVMRFLENVSAEAVS